MSRMLLVNPSIPIEKQLVQTEQFPNGALLLLGTLLKDKGHEVRIIHMTADRVNLQHLEGITKSFNPEVVGITSTTLQSKALREASRVVKKANHKTKIVAGGSHVSALISINYPIAEDYPSIDYFVSGEGDFALNDIIEQKPTSNIIITKPTNGLTVPLIDLSLTNIRKFTGAYPPGPRPGMFVMGSRGCPFSCTFCSRAVFGKTVRYRDPSAVTDDAEKLARDWSIKEIFFHDDTFNLNRKWAEEVLTLIIKKKLNKRLQFRTPCRVNEKLIDLDLLKLMKEAGFWLIFYGVESGDQAMLDRMCKGTKTDEITRAFRLTKLAGIKTEASFIVGLPGETKETIQNSIQLWKKLKPDWSSFTRAIPFPGTEIYREAKQSGHLLIKSFDDIEMGKTLCRTEHLTEDEIEQHAIALDSMTSRSKLYTLLKNPSKLTRVLYDLKGMAGIKRGLKQVL